MVYLKNITNKRDLKDIWVNLEYVVLYTVYYNILAVGQTEV